MLKHSRIAQKKGVGLFGLAPLSYCWWGLLVLGVLGGLAYWGLHPALCVRNSGKELVFFSPLPARQDFCIRFIHSVAKSPVEEWFQVQGKKIVLDRTVYQDFGAGLPHEASTGQSMEFGDGVVVISGYNMHLPDLTVRVGRVAEHTLVLEQGRRGAVSVPASATTGHKAPSVASVPHMPHMFRTHTVLPTRQASGAAAPQAGAPVLFVTPRTEGRVFTLVPLQDLAPAGAALTFSVETCLWNYCAPWL